MNTKDLIKKARKEKGLTQKQLSDLTGISFSMISKLESGERKNPTKETLDKIAQVLGVAVSDLLSFSEVHNIPAKDSAVYDFSTTEQQLMYDITRKLEDLNEEGKKEAYKRIDELSRLDEYRVKEGDSIGSNQED